MAGLSACPKAFAWPVQPIKLLQIWSGAQSLSLVQAWMTETMMDTNILVPCTSASGEEKCWKGIVRQAGKRANFRIEIEQIERSGQWRSQNQLRVGFRSVSALDGGRLVVVIGIFTSDIDMEWVAYQYHW